MSRTTLPCATSLPAPPALLTNHAFQMSTLEQGLGPIPDMGLKERATRVFAGLSPHFHHDFSARTWQSIRSTTHGLYDRSCRFGSAAGQSLKQGITQSWTDSLANLPAGQTVLAVCGQTLQQVVTCGLPTYAREVAFMHTYSALANGLAAKSPAAALTLQTAISLVSIASQVYVRQPRLERPGADSTVAVRGHFGLSEAHWQGLKPEHRVDLSRRQKQDSRNVTRNQVLAEVIYLSLGALGTARGDGALSARILATQLRNVVYAGSREVMQASISLTGKQDDTVSTHGVNENDMATLGWAYAAMTLTMGFVQDSISQQTLPPGQSLSSPALTDNRQRPLQGAQLARSIQALAGMRAGFNTIVAIMDGHLAKHFDARQAGTTQQFKATLPLKDYERVLDQSVARVGWTSLASAANMAMGEVSANLSPALASFLGNTATAAALGLAYRTVNQTFQAHGFERKASASVTPLP